MVQVLRLQEHRRSLKDDEILMIDHVDDTIEEEDESDLIESSTVETLALPSIVITPSLNNEEDIFEKAEPEFPEPPLAEPESLALPSIVVNPSWEKEENITEEKGYGKKIEEKQVTIALDSRNRRVVAMLFRSLPFCSDTTVIE